MQIASSRCPNCGAQLQVHPGATQAACDYCGHAFLVQQSAAPPPVAGYRDSGAGSHQACPACAEVIVAGAKKCKHCGEWLERPAGHSGRRAPPQPQRAMQFMGPPGHHPLQGHAPGVSKIGVALIAFLVPMGFHRMLMGYVGIGIAQLLTCMFGIGIFWCWADGLLILTGGVRMADGRPLS